MVETDSVNIVSEIGQPRLPLAEGEPGCRHHWIIEPPDGVKSLGVCKGCGEQRTFKNARKKGDIDGGYQSRAQRRNSQEPISLELLRENGIDISGGSNLDNIDG